MYKKEVEKVIEIHLTFFLCIERKREQSSKVIRRRCIERNLEDLGRLQ